jgi:DNA gyrase inhibitor GyrI
MLQPLTEQRPDRSQIAAVEREEIEVMYQGCRFSPEATSRAWQDLEAAVSPRGRKFFGTYLPSTGEYRVCVQLKEGDDPEALGLMVGTIAGGRYLRLRIRGEPPGLYDQIEPSFRMLVEHTEPDPERPSIEFYRRRDVIDLLLPVP